MRSAWLVVLALSITACGRGRGGYQGGGGGYPPPGGGGGGGGGGEYGGAPAVDRMSIPPGQGWACFRDRQLKAWSYCERTFEGCADFRQSLINDDASQGKTSDLSECMPQGAAMCHTYYNLQAGKMGWSCSITMVDCQDSVRYYGSKTEKFTNVSGCEAI